MNDNYNLIIGSYVKMAAPLYFLGSVLEAISYGANSFMFYTGAPQNNKRVPLEKCKIPEALEIMNHNKFDLNNVICHAPYLINLANIKNKNIRDMSIDMMINEVNRCYAFGCKTIVLHPGSSLGDDRIDCLDSIINSLNYIFEKTKNDVVVALETMAGKGNELGSNFDELGYIISHVKDKKRIGVCLDTCHLNDSGHDLNDFDSVLSQFSKRIDLKYIKAVHINDSKNEKGCHKDRHQNIGFGTIGFDALLKVLYHPLLNNIPKILETPYIDDKPPYSLEIKMIKSRKFDRNVFENL